MSCWEASIALRITWDDTPDTRYQYRTIPNCYMVSTKHCYMVFVWLRIFYPFSRYIGVINIVMKYISINGRLIYERRSNFAVLMDLFVCSKLHTRFVYSRGNKWINFLDMNRTRYSRATRQCHHVKKYIVRAYKIWHTISYLHIYVYQHVRRSL